MEVAKGARRKKQKNKVEEGKISPLFCWFGDLLGCVIALLLPAVAFSYTWAGFRWAADPDVASKDPISTWLPRPGLSSGTLSTTGGFTSFEYFNPSVLTLFISIRARPGTYQHWAAGLG